MQNSTNENVKKMLKSNIKKAGKKPALQKELPPTAPLL